MRTYVHRFDTLFGTIIAKLPDWVRPFMVLITQLGHPVVTVGLAMFIIGVGYKTTNPALGTAAAVAVGTTIVGSLLKMVLRRNRPVTDYVARMIFHTFSFPSGHAAGVLPIFGLIAYVLLPLHEPWALPLAVVAALIPLFVGISRVYLGAHYASDVVGGWILGAAGLAVIILIVRPGL